VISAPPFRNKVRDKEAEKNWETQASEDRKVAFQESMRKLEDKKNSGIERTPLQIYIDNYIANTAKYWYDWNYDAIWIFDNAKGHNSDVLNNYMGKIINEYDPSNKYGEIKCPVFVAIGKYDFGTFPILWESVVANLDNWTLNIFEKSSHFPMFEEQELFDSKFLEWVTKK
jgi:proline iminopeptidase